MELSRATLGADFGCALGLGRAACFASSLGMLLAAKELNVARNFYFLSRLKPDNKFERCFFVCFVLFKRFYAWKWTRLEALYAQPYKNFSLCFVS